MSFSSMLSKIIKTILGNIKSKNNRTFQYAVLSSRGMSVLRDSERKASNINSDFPTFPQISAVPGPSPRLHSYFLSIYSSNPSR
jgi:hypothetical protein